MEKPKQQPVYQITGTDFEVDAERGVLRERNNPGNEISFLEDMLYRGDHYWFRYDTRSHQLPDLTTSEEHIIEVNLPQMVRLDPAGMAQKYHLTPEELAGKQDFELLIDQDLLAQRRNGILPQIDLAGEPFILDLRLGELRHARYAASSISFKALDLSADGQSYQAFYHRPSRSVVSIDPGLTEYPDDVYLIRLPNEAALDPVGFARKSELEELTFLRAFPLQKGMAAEVIPLSETSLPELIRQNRQRLQNEHLALRRQQPGPRRQPRH